MDKNSFVFQAIGHIRSPFREKFGIPRQPGLVTAAQVELWLSPQFSPAALSGLEGFSHLWLSFVFHQHLQRPWHERVRPPRLGGNEKVGVFASRSPFRPNPIGLSVVPWHGWRQEQGQLVLSLGGADLLDGTPVLDIKPYIPFVDSLPEAKGGFAEQPPPLREVRFCPEALQQIQHWQQQYPQLLELVRQILAQDPRPAYQQQDEREYGVLVYQLNVRFRSQGQALEVTGVQPLAESAS